MSRRSPSYVLYLASGIAGRAGMLAVLVVITRFLGTAEYGFFALVVATGEMLDMIANNWIRIHVLREQAGRPLIGSVRMGRTLALYGAMTFAAAMAALIVAYLVDAPDTAAFAFASVSYIAAFALLRLCQTLMQQQQNHLGFAAVEISRSVLACGAAVVIAALTHSYALAAIGLAAATALCAFAGLIAIFRSQPRPRAARSKAGYATAFAFGAPVAVVAALAYGIGWYDRFILNALAGPAAVGVYAAAFAISRQAVVLFLSAMNTFTFPKLARIHETGGARATAEAQAALLVSMSGIGAIIVAGLAAMAAPLSQFLFPQDIAVTATGLVAPIALATLCVNLKQFVFDNSFYMTKRTGLLIAYMLPVSAISLSISAAMIWFDGTDGAALAYLAGGAIALAVSGVLAQRAVAIDLPWSRLIAIAVAAAASGFASHAVAGAVSDYGNFASLLAGGLTLLATYLLALRLLGFSVMSMISEPWLPQAGNALAIQGPAQ